MTQVETGKPASKQKVLILFTGGTLSMRVSTSGPLKPDKALEDLTTWLPELTDYADVAVEILSNQDSSLIQPELWLRLACRIEQAAHADDCHGIVILHGTDTLAYTASALSFLLPALNLPVVLTGSQRPLAVTRTDARNNILGAVESALEGPNEVMVFFNHHAFRGNRVTKIAIADFDAFDSPNCPPLGKAGIHYHWNQDNFWPATQRPTIWPDIPQQLPTPPWVLPWIPGLRFQDFAPALNNQWALVLEAFGTGNMPFDEDMADLISQFITRGGLVLVKSQVYRGGVSLDAYGPGKRLQSVGVISCQDMTMEAVVTKLMVLKAMGMQGDKMRKHLSNSLVGELSTPQITRD